MNVDLDVSFQLSVLDLIIFILFAWAGYRGYHRGALVQSLSLFALIVGVFISIVLTRYIHGFFADRSSVPSLFTVIFLAIFVTASIFGSHIITNIVEKQVGSLPKTPVNRLIGIGCNVTKFVIIIGIFAIMFFRMNTYANFLPDREKNSKFAPACMKVITTFAPFLGFNKEKIIRPVKNHQKDKL